MWRVIARICAIPAVADWLIAKAQRTPYSDIYSADGATLYMGRWWLFNPYPGKGDERKRWSWLPSIRVHHICVEDQDRHHHTHPWNCRTIIMRGGYVEARPDELGDSHITRCAGDTAKIMHYDLHHIIEVSPGGVWTLFITGRYRKTWGFLIPWREYLTDKTSADMHSKPYDFPGTQAAWEVHCAYTDSLCKPESVGGFPNELP